jgi:hypothetical protein
MDKNCVCKASVNSPPLTFMVGSEVSLMQDAAGIRVHFQSAGVGANRDLENSLRGMAFALEISGKKL